MEKVKTYAEAQAEFVKHGFSFTAESMKFLLEHKKSFSEVADLSNEENCVYMVACASADHDLNKAIDVIYSFMNKGIGIRLLHFMLKELAKDQDFFMNQTNLEIFEEISKKSDLLASQDIASIVTQEMVSINQSLKGLI